MYRFDREQNALSSTAVSESVRSLLGPLPAFTLDRRSAVTRAFVEERTKRPGGVDPPRMPGESLPKFGEYVSASEKERLTRRFAEYYDKDLSGTTVAVQGFGRVGANAAYVVALKRIGAAKAARGLRPWPSGPDRHRVRTPAIGVSPPASPPGSRAR